MATVEQALAWVDRLYKVLQARKPEIEESFDYFKGDQKLVYATPQWREFHEDRYKGFSDNWCGVVGRAPVDRLRIDGFRLGTPTDVITADEKALWADWNRNELEVKSNQGFLTSTIGKRSAAYVWGTPDNEPMVTWEHPSQVVVAYSRDGLGTRLAALKSWTEDGIEYATLQLPDELWKFQRKPGIQISEDGRTQGGLYVFGKGFTPGGGGWEKRQPKSDDKWPLDNPLGEVSFVEWLNRPLLGGDPISDIAGTMAMQDAINMLWAYLFTSADHASMPARVVLGAEPPKVPVLNSDGQIIGSKPAKLEDLAKGRLLFLPGANGSQPTIAQWDAAKLDVFTNVVSQAIGHVAAQTSTPGHYLLTNEKFANLNGDALTAAEVPLATKVGNQQLHFNPAAKDTTALMALVRGKKDLARSIREANGRQFVQWKDERMHSEAQVADAATKDRSVGMSLRTVLERRYGMTETEINRELERVRAEREDPILAGIIKNVGNVGAIGGDADPAASA